MARASTLATRQQQALPVRERIGPFGMRFSVVVPTHGRPRALSACLHALSCLDYPKDAYEVVVIDDASEYAVRALIARFEREMQTRFVRLRSKTGPATARTVGAREAQGTIVAFTDDDCSPDRDWLRALDNTFPDDPDNIAVGGLTINECAGNLYSTATQYLLDALFAWYNGNPEDAKFFPTLNLACGREAFLELGGFDPSFPLAAAEDRDFCDRWRERGGRLIHEPMAIVRHAHKLTMRSFMRQHFSYGRGAVHLHAARRQRGLNLPRLESLGFYRRILFHPFSRERRVRTPILLGLAALTQASYLAGYLFERSRKHPESQST
ncbi:MAG: glycosyltransferase [Gemmatimonadota bacterium]